MKKTYRHWLIDICISVSVLLLILAVYVNWNEIKQIDIKVTEFTFELMISTIIHIITLLIAVVSVGLFYRRVRNQEKQVDLQREQIELQIDQRVDERFTTAISLLASNESSARTGAIYALYHLAVDDEDKKYRKQIAQILCSHIRSKTQESDYQGKLKEDNHKKRPSNEIQTCIDLLFKPTSGGLYTKYAADLDKADLSHAYLMGANFYYAHCQGVDFKYVECQGANFYHAQCQGANFYDIHCQGAGFLYTQCQGAYFKYAQCQGAHFFEAQCQGANFSHAQCQGAYFTDTNLEGAFAVKDLIETELAGRAGEETQLDTMVFLGPLDDEAIKAIEVAKDYIDGDEYGVLKEIIKKNENKKVDCSNVPNGITTGKLEDSEEIQAIIAKDWDKLEELEGTKQAKELAF